MDVLYLMCSSQWSVDSYREIRTQGTWKNVFEVDEIIYLEPRMAGIAVQQS